MFVICREQLRPIQNATKIISSDDNFILVSRTASGKNRGFFLPILSKVDLTNRVQVLYISPLIALITTSFSLKNFVKPRCNCHKVAWWGQQKHWKKTNKKTKRNNINYAWIIGSNVCQQAFNVKQLFSNLKYVVIDEIHLSVQTEEFN
jgi:ATP-dependent Lhr-like helicase